MRPQRPSSRHTAAGRILAVGLVCFGLWLLLDARQLYNSALGSPLGVRRSVALTLLRPLARLNEALSLDRPVNAANRVLSRCSGSARSSYPCGPTRSTSTAGRARRGASGGSGGPAGRGGRPGSEGASHAGTGHHHLIPVPVVATTTTLRRTTTTSAVPSGRRGHAGRGTGSSPTSTSGPTASTAPPGSTTAPPGSTTAPATATTRPALPPTLPPIAQPSPAHPISIVEIGDSLGEDLGFGLQDVLAKNKLVSLQTLAVGDTGLADPAYFNWPRHLATYVAEYHPSIVVVFLGGNDCQPFFDGTSNVTPVALGGSRAFDVAYSARVGALMREATKAGVHVYWVGMPIMGPGAAGEPGNTFSDCMKELNSDYRAEAAVTPGVSYLSTWKLFEGPNGRYAEYLRIDGALGQVRVSDGVHITGPAGIDLVGNAVVAGIESSYHIKL